MAHYSDAGREPLRQNDGPPAGQTLSHRISNLSEISDFDSNPYDAPPDQHSGPLRGRESLVSLDSRANPYSPDPNDFSDNAQSPPASWGGGGGAGGGLGGPFSYSSGGYAPVSGDGNQSFASRALSRFSSHRGLGKSVRRPPPETISEEEYDLSLLSRAAPISGKDGIAAGEDEIATPKFDYVPSQSPRGEDELFMRGLQQDEARGKLTGGIGQGFLPHSTVRDAELLSHSESMQRSMQRSLSRSFSKRIATKPLGRAETLRYAGQDEANRRGEVIEVIVEETADLSTIEGPSNIAMDEARRFTMTDGKLPTTQIFYPQPNWKPFSMRWPWLSMLIIISIGLAAMVAALSQKYDKNNPLVKFKSAKEVETEVYFGVRFAPTIAAVVYGILWQFTDFEVRRLEAYFQMSRPEGALAAHSINVDYVTSFSFWRPFRALKVGHYAVAVSSAATTFAVSLVPTFAAAAIALSPSRSQRQNDTDAMKSIYFSAVWSYLLISFLCLNAVLACGLLYLLQTRRSGLNSDVRGIAGLASMAVVSHILMDFKGLDTAKPQDIHRKLKYHRYMLRNSSLAPDEQNETHKETDTDQDGGNYLSANPHPAMLRPAGSIPFLVALVLFTAFIPAFLFTPAGVVTDKVPWLVTALAVALKLSWTSLDGAVRMMEPYYILSKRHAPSKTLTLDYSAIPFGYLPIQALLNNHFLMAIVGIGTVMAEFLTIMVTGLATVDGREFIRDDDDTDSDGEYQNSGQETVGSFYGSFGWTLVVLLYMFTVALVVFIRRRHPFMPRQPNTISSVLAFIHQSKMLYNFVGTTKLNTAEMARQLDDGKTYGLGWFTGRDGKTHCGVDQEELTEFYKHGVDATQGNEPWNMQWDVL